MDRSSALLTIILAIALQSGGRALAQSDNPSSGLSFDSSDTPKIVYAVYGGFTNALVAYTNVTDKVTTLVKSSGGVPVTEQALLGLAGSNDSQSLLIVYNYQQRVYVLNRLEGAGNVSLDDLTKFAAMHPSHELEIPDPGTPDSDFRIDFVVYGVSDVFWDVTNKVKDLLRDNPEGFYAHEDVMGGDPHFGTQKALVVVFDDAGSRHFYVQANSGGTVNKAVLLDAASKN